MKMETFFSFLKDAGFSTDRTENHVNAATGVSWRPPGACAGKRGERPEETPASEALGLSPPAGALGVCLPMRAQARPPGAQPAAGDGQVKPADSPRQNPGAFVPLSCGLGAGQSLSQPGRGFL